MEARSSSLESRWRPLFTNLTSNSRPSEVFARENYESYLDLSIKISEIAAKECEEVQMIGMFRGKNFWG
jgi:hypothetical protein